MIGVQEDLNKIQTPEYWQRTGDSDEYGGCYKNTGWKTRKRWMIGTPENRQQLAEGKERRSALVMLSRAPLRLTA